MANITVKVHEYADDMVIMLNDGKIMAAVDCLALGEGEGMVRDNNNPFLQRLFHLCKPLDTRATIFDINDCLINIYCHDTHCVLEFQNETDDTDLFEIPSRL